jgi:hypothetical protein
MYTSVKTRKKRRHFGPTCLKIPGENTVVIGAPHHTCMGTQLESPNTNILYRCMYICTVGQTGGPNTYICTYTSKTGVTYGLLYRGLNKQVIHQINQISPY